ncbi:MAG: glycosyltransferase [Cyclobacteriaceae bacterium]|nr:glycosyltransferase [Cyclobacteriaceae bacterium]
MAKVLFYTSIKTRVKDQESLMKEFVKQGHRVFFLNQQPNHYLPEIARQAGVIYSTIDPVRSRFSIIRIFTYAVQLFRYVRKNEIDVVYSHLEPANFIAVLTRFVVRARIIIVRHHLDLAERAGFQQDWSYRLTYFLAKEIICVSGAAKKYMIEKEGIKPDKIYHINLGYDYAVFSAVNKMKVLELKEQHANKLLLITVGRLDAFKRPEYSIRICNELLNRGINVHLFLLGDGNREGIEQLIREFKLEKAVSCLGYTDNVLDYLQAADWLLHPSVSESSCVVVKEAALVELPVIVCSGVGDFDDYLKHQNNALLINRDNFTEEAVDAILQYHQNPVDREQMGKKLKETVLPLFDIRNVIQCYNQFHPSN